MRTNIGELSLRPLLIINEWLSLCLGQMVFRVSVVFKCLLAETWSTAVTLWRARRRKSLCGFVRASFTAGRAAAAAGSTTDFLYKHCPILNVFLFLSYKVDHVIPQMNCLALVVCSYLKAHLCRPVFHLFHTLFYILREVRRHYQAKCTKRAITWLLLSFQFLLVFSVHNIKK